MINIFIYAISENIDKQTQKVYNIIKKGGKQMTCAELKRLLKKHGCYFKSHGGRHDNWYSPLTKRSIQVPRHDSQELKTGTANGILKDAGIK